MASYKTMFPSSYLKKEDFPLMPAATVCTIESVSTAMVKTENDEEEQKPVVKFVGTAKQMVLNWGNAETIASAYGEETSSWIGKKLEVYHDPGVKFGKKTVGGIRVRIPIGTFQEQSKILDASWTWEQALLAAFQAGISKDQVIAELKANGRNAYSMARDTPLIRQMIEAANAKADTSNDEVGFDDPIPF